jgi:hypothetical protein
MSLSHPRSSSGLGAAAILLPLLLATQPASAATAGGASALALAALVGEHASTLHRREERVLRRLFRGDTNVSFPAGQKITVKADSIVCKAGNVDITARSCKLTFAGGASTELSGRRAHELYATIAEVGVPGDGAAGSMFESLSHLVCTIDPNVILQKAGGGADCTFDPGAS